MLGLIYLVQEADLTWEPAAKVAVVATVLSIFAHRLSVSPGISPYARQVDGLGASASKHWMVPDLAIR